MELQSTTVLESAYSLIDLIEEKKVWHQGKAVTLDGKLQKKISGKKTGMVWNGKRYVPQTGKQKATQRRAAIKRGRTMKTGKASRATASRKNARARTQAKRSAGIR